MTERRSVAVRNEVETLAPLEAAVRCAAQVEELYPFSVSDLVTLADGRCPIRAAFQGPRACGVTPRGPGYLVAARESTASRGDRAARTTRGR